MYIPLYFFATHDKTHSRDRKREKTQEKIQTFGLLQFFFFFFVCVSILYICIPPFWLFRHLHVIKGRLLIQGKIWRAL